MTCVKPREEIFPLPTRIYEVVDIDGSLQKLSNRASDVDRDDTTMESNLTKEATKIEKLRFDYKKKHISLHFYDLCERCSVKEIIKAVNSYFCWN